MSDGEHRIRVLVAEAPEAAPDGLAGAVEGDPGLELVGVAASAADAIRIAGEAKPHVAVLDWQIPGGGEEVTTQITARSPDTRVIAFTSSDALEASYDMLHAGAIALMARESPAPEVLGTIHSIVDW